MESPGDLIAVWLAFAVVGFAIVTAGMVVLIRAIQKNGFRFSVRTLLIAAIVVAVVLGFAAVMLRGS